MFEKRFIHLPADERKIGKNKGIHTNGILSSKSMMCIVYAPHYLSGKMIFIRDGLRNNSLFLRALYHFVFVKGLNL